MSWMDSWSRPSSNSKIPAPLYLTGDANYCLTCGRIINSKKSSKKETTNTVKYCSDRCRSRKPGPRDKQIEQIIAALLNGEEDSGIEKTAALSRKVKGDPRFVVTCDEIEEIVFGSRFDPEKVYGRRKNRKSRAIGDPNAEWTSVDMEEDDQTLQKPEVQQIEHVNGVHIRPPQEESEVNFSVGGERSSGEKIEVSAEDHEKRRQGDKRAEEREMVRRAARRAIVFGIAVPVELASKPMSGGQKKRWKKQDTEDDAPPSSMTLRKAEALMNGVVVEPSYAKGNWSIRWRE